MHDPWTIAFEIKNPFGKRVFGIRPSLITIWHKDPEKFGNNDSCGWYRPPLAEKDKKFIADMIDDEQDNIRYFFGPNAYVEDMRWRLGIILRNYHAFNRYWWQHPKWHIHHWRFQIHFLQQLKRFLFSRCEKCGERFSWGYTPVSGKWDSHRKWYQREHNVYHHECYQEGVKK